MKKVTTCVLMFALFGWYLDRVASKELKLIGLGIVGLVVLALMGGLFLASWLLLEKMRMVRARRIEAEKQAHVTIVTNGGMTWIRDTDHKATWHNISIDPRIYANGSYTEPNAIELQAWRVLNGPKATTQAAALASLPALLSGPVELLSALDSVQRCLIVGASDSGKTTLLQHITGRRLNNSKVVVIDPHASPGKWPGCMVIGIGRDYKNIDRALTALVQLMTKRYQDIGLGTVAEMGHNRITIVIDEWRAIAYHVPGAADAIKTLLTESRKAAFSVFVGSHSERVKALGLEGEGDLRDGFTMVRLTIANGIREATIDKGEGRQPASLPGPFVNYDSRIAPGDDFALEVEPDEVEGKVLALHDSGKAISAIAEEVLGSKGGHQNRKVQEILERFSRV